MEPQNFSEEFIDRYVAARKDINLVIAWEKIKQELHSLREFIEDHNIDAGYEEEEQ